jgi:lycopene beta-cyclase
VEARSKYDFIICGAGCAGLSLLMHMIESGRFADKKILLVDQEEKKRNDRTWCFWETHPDLFENIVYRQWQKIWYHDNGFSRLMDILPYQYKMIRGIDFYTYCFQKINQQPNIDILLEPVQGVKTEGEKAVLVLWNKQLEADYLFNSLVPEEALQKNRGDYLLQHFKGWLIETDRPAFHPGEPILMDFRVEQAEGNTFVYVLPFSETKALIEYTLISKNVLQQDQYDNGIRAYLKKNLNETNYTVLEEETGIIPMTSYRFPASSGRIINIGTAGGQTKASTGYTFKFIQKHSAAIVNQLIQTGMPYTKPFPERFHFYDRLFLHLLHQKKQTAGEIFTPFFKKNKPQRLFRFLDNESSYLDDLLIITSLPAVPFLQAVLCPGHS